jgi:hypothetical protein
MDRALQISPRRVHITRLMAIWRSAGWPCRDAVELDLLAAGWATLASTDGGHDTLRLTEAGIRLLAESRQRNQRSLSTHDRLAERLARQLVGAGRVVWRELSLRARIDVAEESLLEPKQRVSEVLWHAGTNDESAPPLYPGRTSWRIARPDVFSVRNTSVEAYLQPMVHEVKVSRPDLLSDLRHAAKRESYQWLSCETYYVFPTGIAELHEIPEAFGVWTLNGSVEDGALELIRPARHSPRKLPFAVWMALSKATPAHLDDECGQGQLGDTVPPSESGFDTPTAGPARS